MKIDKKNPRHWLSLAWMSFLLLLLLPTRLLCKKNKPSKTIILYGHKLHGNLNSIYEHLLKRQPASHDLKIFFLTMDRHYFEEIKAKDNILFALNPVDLLKIIHADCIISDHGLHTLQLLLKLSDITFIDVWHGIPFKGFTADDFTVQHHYDEIWVSSSLLKNIYIEKFGFDKAQVQATGYGRTDLILDYHDDQAQIRHKLNIPSDKKVILFAPTWKQDKNNRSEIPFNLSPEDFFHKLEEIAVTNNAFLIIRYHLNSAQAETVSKRSMLHLPLQEYPNGEELIAISDILITDWSSIAFDMMVLDKPIIFLDVPPPFKNGFSLPPEFRAGYLASSMPELLESLTKFCAVEDVHMYAHDREYQRIKQLVYDDTTDGKTTFRYFARLEKLLANSYSYGG